MHIAKTCDANISMIIKPGILGGRHLALKCVYFKERQNELPFSPPWHWNNFKISIKFAIKHSSVADVAGFQRAFQIDSPNAKIGGHKVGRNQARLW